MSNQERLLAELTQCRFFLMGQLADLAEEEGRTQDANAWRWLAQHRKYPSPRSGGKWGWVFNQRRARYRNVEQKDHDRRRVKDAEFKGPTCLPITLIEQKLMASTTSATSEAEALLDAVKAMGQLLETLK